MVLKRCTECKKSKLLTEFTKDKNMKDGLDRFCRACKKVMYKASYDKNREKINEAKRQFRAANRERINEARQRSRAANRGLG